MKSPTRLLALGLLLAGFLLAAGVSAQETENGKENSAENSRRTLTKIEEEARFHPKWTGMSAADRMTSYEKRLEMEDASRFRGLEFRSVGPLVMSGRVVDVEASPSSPYTWFVAYASGGVWKTTTDGTSWTPLFDRESTITIGDIAVVWPEATTIWVGTGEQNSSRSSYAGTGIFKSEDGGETWKNTGLMDTHHISRIVLHPENPNVVYVAAIGHLYTDNRERGVFKTSDGGESWTQVLFVDERTGCIDLVMDPSDPETLYAASWHRDRKAWNFLESGKGSGIYKTSDGGAVWERLSGGLPDGQYLGRIGLAISSSNPKVIYAYLDNQEPRPKDEVDPYADEDALTPKKMRGMSKEQFLELEKKKVERFLRTYDFHEDYTGEKVLEMVESNEIGLEDLLEPLEEANLSLFDTDIIGPEVYRSNNRGRTWKRTNEERLDGLFYTYGYYFGDVRVDPVDEDKIYILGVPILKSEDGGKSYEWIGGKGVHVDHHALWLDPGSGGRMILGNDGGVNISFDDGKNWRKINNLPVGQFYTVAVDMADPYNIYGGLQDNGVYYGPNTFEAGKSSPWNYLMGGDGGFVQVDPRDNATVYTEYQFGHAYRIDRNSRQSTDIRPRVKLKEPLLRFNWLTPILLSPHSANVVYLGANRVMRSLDKGEDWKPISPDLTTEPELRGDVPFGTLTTLTESPLTFGLIYAGSDDGLVHVTRDGGVTWKKITTGLPESLWVTRLEASKHDEGRIYVSLNDYRSDGFATYLYRSDDFGETWRSISDGLPSEPVNVIREDPENEDLLYVGTDLGCFVSLSGGETWDVLAAELPHVPVHDLVVHPRDKDLVVATHGRSIFVVDVGNLQQLDAEIMAKPLHLFEVEPVTAKEWWSRSQSRWFRSGNEPSTDFWYHLSAPGKVKVAIKDEEDRLLRELDGAGEFGMNSIEWDLLADRERIRKLQKDMEEEDRFYSEERIKNEKKKLYIKPGTYTIEFTVNDLTESITLEVKPPKERGE